MNGIISRFIGALLTMKPFMNPIFLTRLLKSYIVDINRVWNLSPKQMMEYQDKAIRKVIKYAYTVPFYNKKYKEFRIYPDDIKGIKDLKKLPLITKNDLRENYPDGILPSNYDKENGFLLSTSGSSGKPLFFYYDFFAAIKYVEGFMRILKAYGGAWNKSKIALIIDNKPGTVENASFQSSAMPFIKKFMKLDNIKYLYVGEKINKLVKEVNDFDPEYLGSDPHTLKEFAFFKINGKAKNINPRYLISSGAMLDIYTRQYIEKAFNTKVLDNYGSTEAGPMAFECVESGNYHINSDYCYLEFFDENNEDVGYETPGKLVATRLYGYGTPIIRYTGHEDIVTPVEPDNSCGLTSTQMIKNIAGRSMEMIRLPNGKTIAPFHVTTIPASVMDDFRTYKIKQFQIIQNSIDEVEVLIIIDENLREIGPSVKKIIDEMDKRFRKKMGPGINIILREVNDIPKDKDTNFVKVVVSKINKPKK
jgi:phenylacetate-CoA ligase